MWRLIWLTAAKKKAADKPHIRMPVSPARAVGP
jgi:hypothetical protein